MYEKAIFSTIQIKEDQTRTAIQAIMRERMVQVV